MKMCVRVADADDEVKWEHKETIRIAQTMMIYYAKLNVFITFPFAYFF
jgi:hypothetical protein